MHLNIIFLARTKPYRYSAKSLKPSGQQKYRECADNSAIYTDDSKFDNEVGSGIYSGKLDLSISLWQPVYSSVFQAQVLAIYRAAQWILDNGAPFIRDSVFFGSQAAIRSLSGFVDNSRIVRECRRCLDRLSGRFSVSLVWVFGHSNVLENCRADELARAGFDWIKNVTCLVQVGYCAEILSGHQLILGQ